MLAHGGHLLHQTGVAGPFCAGADDAIFAADQRFVRAERRVEGEVLQLHLAFAREDHPAAVQLLGHRSYSFAPLWPPRTAGGRVQGRGRARP